MPRKPPDSLVWGAHGPSCMGKTGTIWQFFFVLCFLALGGHCLQMLCLPGFGTHANTQNLPHFRAFPASIWEHSPPKPFVFKANSYTWALVHRITVGLACSCHKPHPMHLHSLNAKIALLGPQKRAWSGLSSWISLKNGSNVIIIRLGVFIVQTSFGLVRAGPHLHWVLPTVFGQSNQGCTTAQLRSSLGSNSEMGGVDIPQIP